MNDSSSPQDLNSSSKDTDLKGINEKFDLSFLRNGGGPRQEIKLDNIIGEQEKFIPKQTPLFDARLQLSSSKIQLDADLQPPQVAIYVLNNDGTQVPICTLGNFSMIIGKAKSKKTFFITSVAASGLSEWPIGRLQSALPPGKDEVGIFDTEQGAYHVQKMAKRIVRLSNLKDPSKLHVFGLRRYSYKERVLIIEEAFKVHPNVGLWIIDGTRDLIADINDAEESVLVVGKLMKWTEEFGFHIMAVLHQNKGDSNARGHLGTESVNKAETVLSISRDPNDPNVSVVEPEYCRDREPDPIAFHIDSDGLPALVDFDTLKINSQKGKAVSPTSLDEMFHRDILSSIFSKNKKPTTKELDLLIIEEAKKKEVEFGENKARQFREYYLTKKLIFPHGKERTVDRFYTVS